MFDWLTVGVAGIWPIIWHFGLAGILAAGCVLAGVYLAATPKAKLTWFGLAGAIAIFSIAVAIGVSLGEKRVQAQWDAALAVEAESGQRARDKAVDTVGPVPANRQLYADDPWNRDPRPVGSQHKGALRWLEGHRVFGKR